MVAIAYGQSELGWDIPFQSQYKPAYRDTEKEEEKGEVEEEEEESMEGDPVHHFSLPQHPTLGDSQYGVNCVLMPWVHYVYSAWLCFRWVSLIHLRAYKEPNFEVLLHHFHHELEILVLVY